MQEVVVLMGDLPRRFQREKKTCPFDSWVHVHIYFCLSRGLKQTCTVTVQNRRRRRRLLHSYCVGMEKDGVKHKKKERETDGEKESAVLLHTFLFGGHIDTSAVAMVFERTTFHNSLALSFFCAFFPFSPSLPPSLPPSLMLYLSL